MSELKHVAQASIDRLIEWGGNKLLSQMVRLYLENSQARLEQIDLGLSTDDIDQVERGSHSLKSSAANVGATEVSRLANEIEHASEAGDWDTIRSLREPLGVALAAAATELNSVVEGIPEE